MFVPLPRRQLDDAAIDHLLAEIFAPEVEPEPIDANLTEAEAQAILDGFEQFMLRYNLQAGR